MPVSTTGRFGVMGCATLWAMLLATGCGGGGDSGVGAAAPQSLQANAAPTLPTAQVALNGLSQAKPGVGAADSRPATTPDVPPTPPTPATPIPPASPPATAPGGTHTSGMQAAADINFALPAAATTSAGIYDAAGRLVRTLWRAQALPAGAQLHRWDGLADQQQALPPAAYEMRLIHHRVAYRWDGVVGNTSGQANGATQHKAFLPPTSLAAVADRIYYATGYNEAQSGLHAFRINDPQTNLRPARLADPFAAVTLLAADAQRVYWANTGGLSSSSFVSAVDVASGSRVAFTAGSHVCLNRMSDGSTCYADQDHRGVIGAETDASWAPTGLAVQRHGRVLAVAHGGKNLVRLYDKASGRLLHSLDVPMAAKAGNQMAMSTRGDLWVISGRSLHRYSALDSLNPQRVATVTGLVAPLAITVDGADDDAVWVAEGGARQQVLRLNRAGTLTATFGQAGGYADSPAAAPVKLCFKGATGAEQTALAVAADGALWVVDTCNNRLLRVRDASRADAALAYLPAVYAATVDMANPRRVFANFLEFEVDSAQPLQGGRGWVLKRNWLPSLPATLRDAQSHNHGFGGLRSVLTFSNGRTYGLLAAHGAMHIAELPATGPLRLLRTLPSSAVGDSAPVLYENGDLGWARTSSTAGAPGSTNTAATDDARATQAVLRQRLTGFDAQGDPVWAMPAVVATVQMGALSPHYRGAFSGVLGPRFPVTESGRVIFFDSSVVGNDGFHLGAAELHGQDWVWQASPSGVLDDKGSFQTRATDPHITYGGNAVWAQGRHVVYGFHGEFYKDAKTGRVGQANQFMHFFDNGLFVGQFGVPSTRDAGDSAPGLSGNAFSPTLVRDGNRLFLYHNDESSHGGVHRWRVDGWSEVQELRVPLAAETSRG